jgi:hypothetical protein
VVFVHDGRPAVDLVEAARYPLLVSPLGHRTRDLLLEHVPVDGLNIELETANSQARAALGRGGVRVPLIASDSLIDAEFDLSWPAIVVKDHTDGEFHYLCDSHSIYWRLDLPKAVATQVEDFVEVAFAAAEVLRRRPGGSL